jgi:hypothetical protein
MVNFEFGQTRLSGAHPLNAFDLVQSISELKSYHSNNDSSRPPRSPRYSLVGVRK